MVICITIGVFLFNGMIPILPETLVSLSPLQGSNILWTLLVCAASVPLFLLLTVVMRMKGRAK